jgi:tetratricopeptide (TPR) repeat protein
MLLFALVTGAALGARTKHGNTPPAKRPFAVIGGLTLAALLWLTAAGAIALPVTLAESDANAGDNALRARQAGTAAAFFRRAAQRVPYNADYWVRAAGVMFADGRDGGPFIRSALEAQPMSVKAMLLRARAGIASGTPDWGAVVADLRRALSIDPYNVAVRLELADALEHAGDTPGARAQLEEALRINDLLAPDETKRLKDEKVKAIRERIQKLAA